MKKQVFNPFLPCYEYVPDGEPHVFGDRLYLFGSHDRFNGTDYCQNDYVCWSTPVDDLSDWRYDEACEQVASIELNIDEKDWRDFPGEFNITPGVHPLFFVFEGSGAFDMTSFEIK